MPKLPKLEVLKRKLDVVGSDDVTKGDVDLPRHSMCHHLVGDICTMWTWGKMFVISKFKRWEGSKCENFRSIETSNFQIPEAPKLRSPKTLITKFHYGYQLLDVG
jgi:hypothetical protein